MYNQQLRSSKIYFFLPRFENSNGHKLLAYLGSKVWTDLPRNLKDQSNLESFQVNLKDNLLMIN